MVELDSFCVCMKRKLGENYVSVFVVNVTNLINHYGNLRIAIISSKCTFKPA